MNDLLYLFGQPSGTGQKFDQIQISIASPDQIREPGLTARSGSPRRSTTAPSSRSGTASSARKIFGPIKDYECLCGKYKRMKYQAVSSARSAASRSSRAKVRRERMGHIELAAPVAHIWFMKSVPTRIGILLDMTLRDLERVLYFENWVVVEPGLTTAEAATSFSQRGAGDERYRDEHR